VTELDRVAHSFPAGPRRRLQGDLVCYARAVIEDEWPAMRHASQSQSVEDRIAALGGVVATTEPKTAREDAALNLRPSEMQRTLRLIELEPGRPAPPCDARGLPAPA
jgi:hypothetical protein